MARCPHCRFELFEHYQPSDCPRCGGRLTASDSLATDDPLVTVARLRNLAEVGYFADLLQASEIEAHVHQHNDFNAIDGSWESLYLLQVRHTQATTAAKVLQHELGMADEDAEDWTDSDPWKSAEGDATALRGTSGFAKVMMVLMAGGLAYVVASSANRFQPQRVAPMNARQPMLNNRGAISNNLPGSPARRVSYDPVAGMIWIQEDRDGDGQFDAKVRVFREVPARN